MKMPRHEEEHEQLRKKTEKLEYQDLLALCMIGNLRKPYLNLMYQPRYSNNFKPRIDHWCFCGVLVLTEIFMSITQILPVLGIRYQEKIKILVADEEAGKSWIGYR